MLEKKETERRANLLKNLFLGRRDAFGSGEGLCIKAPLNIDRFIQHIRGAERRGVYPLSPKILNGEGVFWGCVDVDDGDLNEVREVQGNLESLGVPAYIEQSKSEGSYHIWVFFSEPILASEVRSLMEYAVGDNGYEVFPKQTSIRNKDGTSGYGNYVNLPLFGADAKEGRTVFLDPESDFNPFPDQWAFLETIQKTTRQTIEGLIADGEIGAQEEDVLPGQAEVGDQMQSPGKDATSADGPEGDAQAVLDGCEFVQYCKREAATLPEQAWHALICNLAPLDGGNELIHELSEPYPGYTPEETDRKIQHALKADKPSTCKWIQRNIFNCGQDCGIKSPIQKGRPRSLQKEKISERNPYFEGNTFIPPFLGDALMKDYSFVTATGKIYLYTNGVYTPIDETVIGKHCRDRLGKYARKNHIAEVMAHITDMTSVDPARLNKRAHLINLNNGMLDWESGELIDHSPDYLSTMRIPVTYKTVTKQDPIVEILGQWVNEDAIPALQEFMGYCLLPDTRYEKALMLTGSGANGKTCFINWLSAMIGIPNTSHVTLQELTEHRFKRAEIFGKLINAFADLDNQGLTSTSFFKVVVSGDMMSAERKGQDPFEFKPFAKLIYSANEIPRSPDNTYAYFRRWIIVDFPNVFEKGVNADEELMEKLTTENMLSNLLAFALDGLRRLYDQRCFTSSESTNAQIEDYQKANDPVSSFMADRVRGVIGQNVKRSVLYDEFTAYCREEGYKAVTTRTFYSRIRSHRIMEKTINGNYYFADIGVLYSGNSDEKNVNKGDELLL